MPSAAYISRRVVFPAAIRPAAVLVDTDSGLITRIAEADAPGPVDQLHDLGTHALLPGFIDPHVHINEPGRTEWEGFLTATRASASAGITTLVDMPLNCLPETTTVAALEAKRAAAAGKCTVDWRSWGGAEGSPGLHANHPHLLPLAAAGAAGFKCFLVYPGCDGLGLLDEPNLRAAMPLIAQSGLPLLVHAELPGPIEAAAEALSSKLQAGSCQIVSSPERSYATYLASRPDEAELAAIRLVISLCREFRTRVHIVHLASALALPLIRAAKAEGLPLTVETCPHYLFFAAEDIPDGATLLKCAPPIRSRRNRDLLLAAVLDGSIDLIASDHSPCPPAMKRLDTGSFAQAWGGIASLSLGPSILNTTLGAPHLASEMWDRTTSLLGLSRLMSSAPAQLAGVANRKGRIAPGLDADLAVFAPEESFTVTPADLHFRHPISPYLGQTLTGRVKQTILRGQLIFDQGIFPHSPTGREIHP